MKITWTRSISEQATAGNAPWPEDWQVETPAIMLDTPGIKAKEHNTGNTEVIDP